MGCQSRCPGCKELKPAHDFGYPGKDCMGPVHNNTEQDLEVVDELEQTDEVGATKTWRLAIFGRIGAALIHRIEISLTGD